MKRGIIKNDEKYLDEYFEICKLFQKKREARLKILVLERQKGECSKRRASQLKTEITKLNSVIKERDRLFWSKVQNSPCQGKAFTIEALAKHYSLNAFEKKVVIFFLYLELNNPSQKECSRDDLLFIFNIDSPPLEQMRCLTSLHDDHVLLTERILLQNCRQEPPFSFGDYALSGEAIITISKMLNGEVAEWPTHKTELAVSPADDVGYVKEPSCSLRDVVLSADIKERVALFLDSYKDDALEKSGAFDRFKKGKGLAFLFYGPPGTGKSMLAEAVAHSLGKKALMVEYPKITARWLGETDKRISHIFRSAKANDLVVIMDEADSLLYDRGSFAAQEHDIRFVNIMLQELEKFEGVVILTSNMDALLDPALERRISLKVKFELPEKKIRAELWKAHIPDTVMRASDVDYETLAGRYDFAGGNIKNAVLNAMRKMNKEKRTTITADDLIFGADVEKDGMFCKKHLRTVKGFAEKCI